MNLRSYFRILRPGTVLFVAGFYSAMGAFQLQRLLNLPADAHVFFTVGLIAPLLFGAMIAGAAHELMHKRFFLLLPGARQELRRWTIGALVTVWLPVCGFIGWWRPTLLAPVAAVSAAVLALPLLNRRGTQGSQRLLVFGAALVGGTAAITFSGVQIVAALQVAGWWILPVGVAVAVGVIALAFRPAGVRERSGRFFQCAQTAVWGLFRRHGRETLAVAVQENLKRQETSGRDWSNGPVDGSARQWVRVLLHEMHGNSGAAPRSLRLLLVCICVSLLPVAISVGGALALDAKMTLPRAVQALATAGAPGTTFRGPDGMVGFSTWLPAWIAIVVVFVRVLPRAVYPISRDRFAWCVFLLAQRQVATALGIQLVAMLSIVGVAGLVAGTGLRWDNFQLQLSLLIVQIPFLPLLQSAALLSRGFVRILAGIVVGGVLAGTILYLRTRFPAVIVTWSGLTVSLALFAATSALYWRLLRRELRGRDMDRGFGLLLPQQPL